jgi:hypothetical protein
VIRIGSITAMAAFGAEGIYLLTIIYLLIAIAAIHGLMATGRAYRNLLITRTTLFTTGAVIIFMQVKAAIIISSIITLNMVRQPATL